MKKSVAFSEIQELLLDKLSQGATAEITVKGNSMYPFYVDGVTNVVLKKAVFPLKKNQVVFYHASNRVVLHRIRKVKENEIITCGDALSAIEHVSFSDVFAIVVSHQTTKEIQEVSKKYLFMVSVWYFLKPIRRLLVGFIRRVDRRGK